VLDGFERFLQTWPAAVLLMVYSDDTLLAEVRHRVSRSSLLASHVRLLGSVPHAEMAGLYSAADLFVIGSHYEGSGYALLEACACGVFPVVTNIAPFRKITGDGRIGVHWTPGHPASCAAALTSAVRRDLVFARDDVRAHFSREASWSAVGARARAVYEEVCRSRSRGPAA
jgi:glycosyltransferase involved in cell wall biosynthesis